jgi:hypothetical protein
MRMVEQFIAAFNDIVIKGYDKNSNLLPNSDKKVRFLYAPKSRVYESLNTPGPGGITLPVVSISLGNISRDKERVFNKHEGFVIPYNTEYDPSGILKKIPQPVPVNITVNMSIITKFQEHMDQILSNFIPYCDPYIIISWRFPGLSESDNQFEIRSKVLWSGSTNLNYPTDLNGTQPYSRLSADTTFTIEGWLFKRMDEVYKKIYYIDYDFISSNLKTDSLLETLDDINSESFHISAAPLLKSVYPLILQSWSVENTALSAYNDFSIDVYGKYLLNPRNVYLSGSNISMLSGVSLFSPFSSIPNLSGYYPSFYAIKVPDFEIVNDESIRFTIPQAPQTSGFLDVIIENEAGYGKLTTGSLRPSISSWSGWTYEPHPLANGLKVVAFSNEESTIMDYLLDDDLNSLVDENGNFIIW